MALPNWPRRLSEVFEDLQIWYYPPPEGPRTWAFRMPGQTEGRHYTRQNGAKDAIRALKQGRQPQPGVDPVAHLRSRQRGAVARIQRPAMLPAGGTRMAIPNVRIAPPERQTQPIVPTSSSPGPWLADLGAISAGALRRVVAGDLAADVWSVHLRFSAYDHPALANLTRRERWSTDYGKPLVESMGKDGPAQGSCAEVEVARRLRSAGWDAWWSDGYGQAPVRWKPWVRRVSEWGGPVGSLLRDIRRRREDGASGGVPDVVAVRAGHVVFVECKGPGDRTSRSQLLWLAATVGQGLRGNDYVLVEFEVIGDRS